LTLPLLIVLILATWRLCSLIADEDGPWYVLENLRHRLGVAYDEHNHRYGRNEVARGLLCPWCLSMWVGTLWTLLWLLWPDGVMWVALPFALSAGAIVINRMGDRDE
jgi:hypothetical protein